MEWDNHMIKKSFSIDLLENERCSPRLIRARRINF